MDDQIKRMHRCTEKFSRQFGRSPSPKELAEETGFTPAYIKRLRSIERRTVSMDQGLGAEGELTLQDTLKDPRVEDPADSIRIEEMRILLQRRLSLLTERETKIVKLRFGLGEDESLSLGEVGKKFGLSRERIRQIEAEALEKLRAALDAEGINPRNFL